jgi:hypothetical protein
MSVKSTSARAEFVKLRQAYELLADIYDAGGAAERSPKGIRLSGIPKDQWSDVKARMRGCEDLVLQLIEGHGEKRAMAGETEVVLAAMESDDDVRVAALLLSGRSKIKGSLCFSLSDDDWQERLVGFADWDEIPSVISSADGNNQRALIGLVLSLAGIGRGKLSMTEVEIPQEIDEATHLVRGAEWMKAGLPRFRSAASEALWYAMRLRSVHSRVVRSKKQGLYTSMALTALYASGFDEAEIAEMTNMSKGLVAKLIFTSPDKHASERDLEFMREFVFDGECEPNDSRLMNAGLRIWKGPAIFKRGMDWRISISRRAREALFEGKDLVEVAEGFRIQRRELVRILSVSLAEAVNERDRFLEGVLKPSTLRALLR